MAFPTGKGDKLPDEWFTWIGRVVVEWDRLERSVEGAIWGLLNIQKDEIGQAVTSHIPTRVRLDIYLALADKLLTAPEREDVVRLVKRITELGADRNLLAHGLWLPWATPKVVKVRARGSVKSTMYEPTIPLIAQLYRDIADIADKLEILRHAYPRRPRP